MAGFTGLFLFLQMLIGWYIFIIVIDVVLTLLIQFGVLNSHNTVVSFIHRATYAITEPALRPIRRRLPAINGVDLSPLVLIFALYFISWVVIGNCAQPGFISGVVCRA
ncbi:MAG: YggT family protein [Pseudomonadota bacterium]